MGEIQAVHVSFFGILPRADDIRSCPSSAAVRCSISAATASARRRLVLGEPQRVYGEAWLGRGGVDERFPGRCGSASVVATFQCGFTARTNRLEVVGSDGVLLVPQAFVNPPGIVVLDGEEHSRRRPTTTTAPSSTTSARPSAASTRR